MTNQSSEWLTIREAALRFGLSELTVRRRIKDGRFPSRLLKGKYYVNPDGETSVAERSTVGDASPAPPTLNGAIAHPAETKPDQADYSDQSTKGDHVKRKGSEGAASGPVRPPEIDLTSFMSEHARLAEAAGRAGVLEEELKRLQERHASLQDGALSLASRNGWLESKLEERERDIKLLGDSKPKRSWWKRLFGATEATV